MMKFNKLVLVSILVFSSQVLFAFDLEVDVLNNDYQPISFLISDFYVDKNAEKVYTSIKKIVTKDINDSGAFDLRFSNEQIITSNIDFKNTLSKTEFYPYNHYQYIVIGKIIYSNNNKTYNIELSVLNSKGKFLRSIGYKLESSYSKSEITKISHDISNEIYETILDIKGYFTSSLLFVSDNKLIISDYNGENQKILLETKGTVLSPSFSHNGEMIVYIDFFEGRSVIYLYDVYFKKTRRLANLKGLSLSPVFSNDDKKIIFAIANEGSTHIYEAQLEKRELTKLTEGYSINMLGNYSQNNQYIVFSSDRAGIPGIYIMDTKTNSLRKISKEAGSYHTPSFSYNSNLILFTKIHNKKFQIGVLSLNGKEKILSGDTLAESPSWLVDGRHIIYQYAYKKSFSRNLYSFYILDLLSGHKILLNPTKDAQNPSLSKGVIPTKKVIAKYYF